MSVNDLVDKDDRPAFVRFEVKAVKDPQASLQAGHYVSKDEDWVLVSALGSRDIFTKRAEKWFTGVRKSVERGRTPIKHLELYEEIYKRWKKGLEPPVDGTSVKNWNAISPAQCANLISAGLRTIEDVAEAPDDAIRRYGMGGVDIKHQARAWLQAAKDHGPLTGEIAVLKKENEQLRGTIQSLNDKISRFEIQEDAQKEYIPMEHSPQVISPITVDVVTPAEQYQSKFGKPPHHRMKEETIIRKLQE